MKKRARSSVTDLPWRPTFFLCLLSTCNTPEEIIARTLVLRRSPEVAEYRGWLKDAFQEWETHGHLASKQKDIRAITKAIDRSIGAVGVAPTIE